MTNLGVATGPGSNLFVVDLDGAEGISNFDELANENGDVPDTLTVKTGGGGEHIYFRYPKGVEIKNSVSEFGFLGSKIDIRGDNGFVVAPPSRHASGKQYEWVEGLGPDDVPIADAPQWIVDATLAATKSDTSSKNNKKPASKGNETSAKKTGNSNSDISDQAGSSVKNLLNKIGDGKGQNGFNSPINKVAIAYFHGNGTDADFDPLKELLLEQVNVTEKKPERLNLDRYLSDEYLDEAISNACKYVQASPASKKPDWLPSNYTIEDRIIGTWKGKGGDRKFYELCQTFGVIGKSRENGEDDWSLEIDFKNSDGKLIAFSIPKGDIFDNSRKIKSMLASKDFYLNLHAGSEFDELVLNIDNGIRINTVTRPGWHDDAFVCPTGQVIGDKGTERTQYKYPIRNVEPAGSIEGAKKAMDAALNSGVSHWMLGVFGGGIACMLQLLGQDSCLIALTGETSKGKTTALKISATWWGNPNPQHSDLLVTLNGTENAFEGVIESSTGVGLFGDEMKLLKGDGIQNLIFLFAGGTGKKRMKADSSLQIVRHWENFAILSGEEGLSNAISQDRKTPANGIKARCLEIDVTNAPIVEQSIVDSVKACGENYGHIGPTFVTHIIDHEDIDKLKARLVELTDEFDAVINDAEADGVHSSLKRRAIVVMAPSCIGW